MFLEKDHSKKKKEVSEELDISKDVIISIGITHLNTFDYYCEEENPFVSTFIVTKSAIEPKPFKDINITYTMPISALKISDSFTKEKKKILNGVHKLKENYDDIRERQINFVELKGRLIDLRNQLTLVEKNLLRLINMCIDALENTRAECITPQQIDALEFTLQMAQKDIDLHEVNQLQEILINLGLKPIPNIEGIAELYE